MQEPGQGINSTPVQDPWEIVQNPWGIDVLSTVEKQSLGPHLYYVCLSSPLSTLGIGTFDCLEETLAPSNRFQ